MFVFRLITSWSCTLRQHQGCSAGHCSPHSVGHCSLHSRRVAEEELDAQRRDQVKLQHFTLSQNLHRSYSRSVIHVVALQGRNDYHHALPCRHCVWGVWGEGRRGGGGFLHIIVPSSCCKGRTAVIDAICALGGEGELQCFADQRVFDTRCAACEGGRCP